LSLSFKKKYLEVLFFKNKINTKNIQICSHSGFKKRSFNSPPPQKSSIGLMLYRPFFSFNFQASRGLLFQIFEQRFVLKKSCDLNF